MAIPSGKLTQVKGQLYFTDFEQETFHTVSECVSGCELVGECLVISCQRANSDVRHTS